MPRHDIGNVSQYHENIHVFLIMKFNKINDTLIKILNTASTV